MEFNTSYLDWPTSNYSQDWIKSNSSIIFLLHQYSIQYLHRKIFPKCGIRHSSLSKLIIVALSHLGSFVHCQVLSHIFFYPILTWDHCPSPSGRIYHHRNPTSNCLQYHKVFIYIKVISNLHPNQIQSKSNFKKMQNCS